MPYPPGDILLDKYRIEALIGQGAFGDVYRVTHVNLKVPRAIKILRRDAPGMGTGMYQDAQQRFLLEGQLGARLNNPLPNPHLLQVHDFMIREDLLLLEMEYAAGGSLSQRIKELQEAKKPFPLAEALKIAAQVASGLAALHAIDIVHRDLKPNNILFDEHGDAHLADLGVAQIRGGPTRRTELGEEESPPHPGTVEYMSPEQQTTRGILKSSSDIYAMGLVLFEMLTGRSYTYLRPGTRARSLRAELPAEVDELLARMLAENPRERPWDGDEAAKALQGVLDTIRQEQVRTAARQQAEAAALEQAQMIAQAKAQADAEAETRREAEEQALRLAQAKAQADAEEQARQIAQAKANADAEEKARLARLAEEQALRIAQAKIQADLDEKARLAQAAAEKARRESQADWIAPEINPVRPPAPPQKSFFARYWPVGLAVLVMVCLAGGYFWASNTKYLLSGTLDCSQPDVFCVGVVTDVGKIDDKSFNQAAWEGAKMAEKNLGATVQYIETTDSKDYQKNIAQFADTGFDVIVTVGFALGEATSAAASSHPNIKFIGVDQFLSTNQSVPANLTSLLFHEDQAGFLAGALAAQMSRSMRIGSISGTDIVPPVWRFGEGFRAGALYINPAVQVSVVYHNEVGIDKTFSDPDWGAATAKTLISDKAVDVIFGTGGMTGNGALRAAAQQNVYAIGSEIDQYFTLPEARKMLLSSAIKMITTGVYDLITLARDGKFPTGSYYGSVGFAPYHDLDSLVPTDVRTKMEAIGRGLNDGSIKTNVSEQKP